MPILDYIFFERGIIVSDHNISIVFETFGDSMRYAYR